MFLNITSLIQISTAQQWEETEECNWSRQFFLIETVMRQESLQLGVGGEEAAPSHEGIQIRKLQICIV